MMELILLVLIAASAVWGVLVLRRRAFVFSEPIPYDHVNAEPVFDLRTHLNGPILCEGLIYGPTGRVSARFIGEFEASWQGNQGVMREVFRYDTGNSQEREWAISLNERGGIEVQAGDVIGTGKGEQRGDGVLLRYRIRLPKSAGSHVLDVVDRMYLTPSGTIENRSQFRKFGIQVAQLEATMRPAGGARRAG